jgi:hypothetical protein
METRGVSHCELAIYNKKYLNAKEELWKFKYFTMQKHNFQKNPSRRHNSITDLKFQHKPKDDTFEKSSYKNRLTT